MCVCVVEIDREGCVAADDLPEDAMGDESLEITDEMEEASSAKRSEAAEAFSEGLASHA